MEPLTPAETTLQLLFKKLHPHLEDVAHALATRPSAQELERLHAKLLRAREQTAEILEGLVEECEEELGEIISDLATNLTPVGENFQQSLTLTQLCLEDAPAELLPFIPADRLAQSAWGKRMDTFLAQVQNPTFEAHARWASVNPDIGDEGAED